MIELNKENFEAEVTNYTEKPVFIDFWGDKCETCIQMMPDVHKLAEQYGDKIKFCSFNTGESRRLAISQKVLGLPTMSIYLNGERTKVLTPDKISSVVDIEALIKEFYL